MTCLCMGCGKFIKHPAKRCDDCAITMKTNPKQMRNENA